MQQHQETSDSIEVLIRIRPFSEREKFEEQKPCFRIDGHSKNTIIFDATTKSEAKYFTFDHVCNDQISQDEIFRIIGIPTATSCLGGYNGCIFAYGQTGAGKTYTIQGPGLDISMNNSLNPEENEKRGILPRVVEYMFSNIESAHDTSSNVFYTVRCNFLEIYNEHIVDLLNPSAKNLQIREDIKKGIYIDGLYEEKCKNSFETLELVKKGNKNRHIGATNMNIESSRSHSVFTLTIEAKVLKEGITNTRRSRFSFVDLAGSESQKMASTVGERLKEGCLINKSLMALARVINSLVDISEGKSRFVNYRDSKLTFLLKDSLGGNSKTSIIANISPAFSSYGETLSTIKFAQRAKLIKNKVHINEDASGTLESLKDEMRERLRSRRREDYNDELKLKMVVRLLSDKVDRFKALVEKKVLTKEDYLEIVDDEDRNDLKERILQILKEPENESSRHYERDMQELREENNRLREEYVNMMGILNKQEEPSIKICEEHKNQMEIEGKASTDKEALENEKNIVNTQKKLIEKLKYEYICDSEVEIAISKEIIEKHEMEKKTITEEIELLCKALEEKTKQEHDEKLAAFVAEQEKVMEHLKIDFMQVKNERDAFENEVRLLQNQVKELEEQCRSLVVEKDSFSDRILYHKDLEDKLNKEAQEALEKLTELFYQNFEGQKQIEELKRSYEKAVQSCLGKNLEIEGLRTILFIFKRESEAKTIERNRLKKIVDELQKSVDFLSEFTREIKEFSQEFINAKEQYARREQSLFELDELNKALSHQVQLKDKDIESLQGERQRLIKIEKEDQFEIADLNSQIITLTKEFDDRKLDIENINQEFNQLHNSYKAQIKYFKIIQNEKSYWETQVSELNKLIERKENELQRISEENNQKAEEIERLTQNSRTLQENLTQKEQSVLEQIDSYEGLKNEIQAIKRVLEQSNQEKTDLREKLEEKRVELEDLIKTHNTLEIEFVNKAKQVEELQKSCNVLNQNLSEKEHCVQLLEGEKEKLQGDYNELEEMISNLRSEIQELRYEGTTKQSENENLKTLYEELQKSLSLEKENLISATRENEYLVNKNSQKEEEINVLKKEYEILVSENKENIKQMRKFQEDYEITRNNYQNIEGEHSLLRQEREVMIARIEELQQNKALHDTVSQEKVQGIEQEKEKLLKELDDTKQNEKKLKEEMKRYMQTVGKLKLDYEKSNNELTSRDEKIIALNAEMEQLQEQIAQYEQEQGRFENEYKEFTAERKMFEKMEESLREQIQQLSRRSEKLTEEHKQNRTKFNEEILALEKENGQLTESLSSKQEELLKLSEELKKYKNERENLSKQIKDKSLQEVRLLEEKEMFSHDMEQVKQEWRQTVQDLEKRNLELTEGLQRLREEIVSKEEALKSLQAEYENVNTIKEEAENEIDKIVAELKQSKSSNKKLETLKIEYEKRHHKMEQDQQKLKQEFENARNELTLKNKELFQLKENQNNLVTQLDQLAKESEYYKEQVAKLEKELKEEIAKMYEQRERDINEVTEQYLRLTQEHKSLIKTISLRDDQLAKTKEELQLISEEKDKIQLELQNSKILESKLKQDNQEQFEKITRLNSDQYLLLKEIDNLNQANDSLGGHNNMGQKIRHLNKLKEENNKIKHEKVRAVEEMTKAIEQKEKLQKKVDELQAKLESKGIFEGNRESINPRIEERKSLHHNQSLSLGENLSRISSLIHNNLSSEDAKFVNSKSNDIESVLNAVQALTMLIMEKNKTLHNKETELASIVLKNSILEKELLLSKQKAYMNNPNPSTSNSISALSEINNLKRVQHSPLETKEKARIPIPNKSIGDRESFHRNMENKLNSVINNRSNSLRKGELKPANDENFLGTSFDFPGHQRIKQVSVKKSFMK